MTGNRRRVLGIDPGSLVTGYGIVDFQRHRVSYVTSGCIRTSGDAFTPRLKEIFDRVSELVCTYQPAEVAMERVFMHRNADSALKLGQARAAAICATFSSSLPMYEYAAREVKKAVVGKGAAEKGQVQHMVKVLLNLSGEVQADAADGLAVALCHAHMCQTARAFDAAGAP